MNVVKHACKRFFLFSLSRAYKTRPQLLYWRIKIEQKARACQRIPMDSIPIISKCTEDEFTWKFRLCFPAWNAIWVQQQNLEFIQLDLKCDRNFANGNNQNRTNATQPNPNEANQTN